MSYTADKDGVRNNASGHYIGQNRRGMTYRLNRMRRNMEKEKQYQKAREEMKAMPVSAKRKAFASLQHKGSRNVLAEAKTKMGGKKRRTRKSRKSRRKSRKSNRRRTRRRTMRQRRRTRRRRR